MTSNRHIPNVLEPFSAPYATREERRAYADGLRALAGWVEATHFPIPRFCLSSTWMQRTFTIHSSWIEDEGFVRRVASAARLIGDRVEKVVAYDNAPFELVRNFGGGVEASYQIQRSAVCEAVEVVKEVVRDVPEDKIEAGSLKFQIEELQKELDSLPKVRGVLVETKTEYHCPPSLLADEARAEVA